MADPRATLPEIFAVMRDPRLSDPEVRLWGIYRSYDRGDGAYPGDETIQAHMASVGPDGKVRPKSLRAIQGYRASLVQKGYLVRELRGPNPAVYRAVVPAVGVQDPAPLFQAPQNPAPLEVKNPAPLSPSPAESCTPRGEESCTSSEGVQQGVQEGVQNPALTPTPPIEEEYGKYGKEEAGVAEALDSSGPSDDTCSVFDELGLHQEAAAVLRRMRHPGGERGTVATLRTSYLYLAEADGLPDRSVGGLELSRRRELVSRALLDMQAKGVREWSPVAIAGFVRRIRERPDPTGDHPGLSAAEEEADLEAKREAARRRAASAATDAQQAVWDRHRSDLAEAREWLSGQDAETRARLEAEARRKCEDFPGGASKHFAESTLIGVVRAARTPPVALRIRNPRRAAKVASA